MTISKEAWLNIEKVAGEHHIYPRESNNEIHIPLEVEQGEGIELIAHDFLVDIRNCHIPQKYDEVQNKIVNASCNTVLNGIFRRTVDTIKSYPSLKIYVICLDPIGRSRPEKAHTAAKRLRSRQAAEARGEPTTIELPPGETRYFHPQKPFPSTMNVVFKIPEARKQLYEFIIDYLSSPDFRQHIPEGRSIIVSGGYYQGRQLDPLKIETRGEPEELHEHAFPTMSEGDLDVCYWVQLFSDLNFQIRSGDGDPFMIVLMQLRHILKINPSRKGWFVTSRVVDSKHHITSNSEKKLKEAQIKLHDAAIADGASLEEAFHLSGGRMAYSRDKGLVAESSKKRVWLYRYVDVVGLYNDIIEEAHRIEAKENTPIHNFVESFVLALFLSSKEHDYVDCSNFAPGVGSDTIWLTFIKYTSRFADLVRVSAHDSSQLHYYLIDVEILRDFLKLCYIEAGQKLIKPSKKNPDGSRELELARKEKGETMIKTKMPIRSVSEVVASQAAWTLAYWGNGADPELTIPDGLAIDPACDLPYFGYDKQGFAPLVTPGRIRCAPLYISE